MKTVYTCGCWDDEEARIGEFCTYHDNLAAAEEFNDEPVGLFDWERFFTEIEDIETEGDAL